ncbi:MAG: hypothetical protein J2P48_13315 [Alphaproteobacteria bacterium]|nr:hypothetical protein [Alphaproteobacteria bacterium]
MAELDERVENNAGTAYERSDWPIGTIGLVLLGIFVMLVISPLVLIAAFPTTPADVNRALTVEPPQPRLQTNPAEDLAKFRHEKEKPLNGYYWVDRKNGIVHIPIEQAMRKLAEQGIDGFPRAQP